MSVLTEKKKVLNDMIWQARAMISYFENEIKDLNVRIIHEQSICSHNAVIYAEGRHGSDKGTLYYRCSKCSYEWED